MLKPGVIPHKEPVINIGVILPEDRKRKIKLVCPDDAEYSLITDNDPQIKIFGHYLSFEPLSSGIVCFYDKTEIKSQSFEINIAIKVNSISPQSGLKVKDVPAGRSFHWKKEIDVLLPGSLTIKQYEDHLILINHVPLEQYLMCVATSEMSNACPTALIEAQTVAARSWLLANVEQKHRHLGMDVCNDDCCQRYQGSTFLSQSSIDGALNTRGQALIYDNQICDARYSKSCGGVMESFDALWNGPPHPYLPVQTDIIPQNKIAVPDLCKEENFANWLKGVPPTFCSPHYVDESTLQKYLGSVDEQGKYFRWGISVTQEELVKNIRKLHQCDIAFVLKMNILNRAASGRINQLEIEFEDSQEKQKSFILNNEYVIRQTLHPKFLYSSAIILQSQGKPGQPPDTFVYKGAGWGHGAGMCQIGALGMALHGYQSKEILMHYYKGSEIRKIY